MLLSPLVCNWEKNNMLCDLWYLQETVVNMDNVKWRGEASVHSACVDDG